jgi:hypothetical protein
MGKVLHNAKYKATPYFSNEKKLEIFFEKTKYIIYFSGIYAKYIRNLDELAGHRTLQMQTDF